MRNGSAIRQRPALLCPGRILPAQTRAAFAALRQVADRMPDRSALFANSPSFNSRLTPKGCGARTEQSRSLPKIGTLTG